MRGHEEISHLDSKINPNAQGGDEDDLWDGKRSEIEGVGQDCTEKNHCFWIAQCQQSTR